MTLAQALLACLETELAAHPAKPVPAERVMLRAGAEVTPLLSTSTDECCTGLGWVRIAQITGVREINDTASVHGCFGQERVLTLEMGVARCAPTPSTNAIPTADQWTQVALLLDLDQGAMEAAVCCAFGDLSTVLAQDLAVGDYEPFGVDGNCVGGTMTVRLVMEACC
ncbi:hypothetical protein [Streptomyces sp. NPDC046332]|uniref:hypothetical protein n=1 Tax=unclassified Streptomyces TaxID=2593676 RepID=UPI0033C487B3